MAKREATASRHDNGEREYADGVTPATRPTRWSSAWSRSPSNSDGSTGTVQAKAEGWMDREALNKQIAGVRDSAAELLEQL